ncbi:MAG: hypothetical protein ACRETG_03310 [Steroidobacteraceae bacterium]
MERVATFRGVVSCRREPHGPLGLTLTGRTDERPEEPVTVSFAGSPPADLPAALHDAIVEHCGTGEYRIASASRTWLIGASSVHLHRDVGAAFYRAIPPRAVPRARRLFFTVVLGMAGTRAGIALLRALRR